MDEDLKFNYLTKPVLNFNVASPRFKLLLNASEEYQVLNGKPHKYKEIRGIFREIDLKLRRVSTRHVGVLLLDVFLPQCYDDIFESNAIEWMKECISILNSQSDSIDAVTDTYRVLNSLFELSGKFHELHGPMRDVVIQLFLEHVFESKTGVIRSKIFYVLNCLKSLLIYYKGFCFHKRKEDIMNFLLDTVDSSDSSLTFLAGQCMCFLSKGEEFEMVFRQLCGTASQLLYNLFTNVSEVSLPKCITDLPQGFSLKESSHHGVDVPMTYRSNALRFANVLSLMEGMLMTDSNFCKQVKVPECLGVVCRALTVNNKNIARDKGTVEHFSLLSVLPRLHVAAFNFLGSFVTCYDGVLGYGTLFCQLVVDTLKWTDEPYEVGNRRPFGNVRKAACSFLETWVVRAKAASCVELYSEDLFVSLLNDIVQKEKTVELQDKQKAPDADEYLAKVFLLNPQANAQMCATALSTVCAIIEASGSLVKKHHHVRLQETVIGLLLEVRRKNLEYMPFPFSAPECRLQLYRVLLALTLHPHGSWPAPLQFALTLFPYGQRDPSNEVASFCLLATAAVRQMAHPSRSNAQFPISIEDMRVSVDLQEKASTYNVSTPLQEKSINSKRKLQTPTSDTSLNEGEGNTPASNKKAKTKGCSPAAKRKKTVPKDLDASVNGSQKDGDSSKEQLKENALESSDCRKGMKSSSLVAKKKEVSSFNGLDEDDGNSGKKKKKKPKQLLETSAARGGDGGGTPLSSERPLKKKKKRGLSESSVESSDLSAGTSILRPSVDNWEVADLPQKVKEKKIKKQKKKMQTDEGSVDVEPLNNVGERTSAAEIQKGKNKRPSSEDSWNVSDVSRVHKVSPVKIVSPSAETVSPVQQKKNKESSEKGENTTDDVAVPFKQTSRGKERKLQENKKAAEKGGGENTQQRKEEAETSVAMTDELEVDARKRKVASSESALPGVTRHADHLSTDEKGKTTCSTEKSPKKKSLVKEAGKTSGGIKKVSDSVRAAKETFQEDKHEASVKDAKPTAESVTNTSGDKRTLLDCDGEKSRDDVPSTPDQKPESVSQDNDTVTIEEITIHEGDSVEEKAKDAAAATRESSSSAPVVDLAVSDNSCSVVSLDSDAKEERASGDRSGVKESAVNTSFEDGQDPDASTGMDAVVESPRVSLEGTEAEAAERGASGSPEKLTKAGRDSKKDSDTDEEDILTTFVDIVSTESK